VDENQQRFFILTGGPGSGKSTLIDALEQAGFARSVEAGRGIIQDQVAIGGRVLPWSDPAVFAEHMLTWEMRSYHIAEQLAGRVFFDRGVPDVAGYLRLMKLPVPEHVEKAVKLFRYHRRVFLAPPGKRFSSRISSASKILQRRYERTRRSHRPMWNMDISWWKCHG